MPYLASFIVSWGWLIGAALVGLCDGLDLGGSARQAPRRSTAQLLEVRCRRLVAFSFAHVVPGRAGYWLDLALVMFALYLCRLYHRLMVARLGGLAHRAGGLRGSGGLTPGGADRKTGGGGCGG